MALWKLNDKIVAMRKELEYFAIKLRELREAKGFTQAALARLADVQLRMFAKYESGEAAPTLPVIAKLAKTLGISVDYLISPNCMDENAIRDKELFAFFLDIDSMGYGTKLFVKEMLESIILREQMKQKKVG